MASDIKIDIDGIRLNVRVGVIMRFDGQVIIEVSKIGRNSVVPGGRIHINEKSSDALVREIQEEMHIKLDKNKLKQIKVFENFFKYDEQRVHEIYFLYDYSLTPEELKTINLEINEDDETTYFKLVSSNELEKYDLMPVTLHDIIRNA